MISGSAGNNVTWYQTYELPRIGSQLEWYLMNDPQPPGTTISFYQSVDVQGPGIAQGWYQTLDISSGPRQYSWPSSDASGPIGYITKYLDGSSAVPQENYYEAVNSTNPPDDNENFIEIIHNGTESYIIFKGNNLESPGECSDGTLSAKIQNAEGGTYVTISATEGIGGTLLGAINYNNPEGQGATGTITGSPLTTFPTDYNNVYFSVSSAGSTGSATFEISWINLEVCASSSGSSGPCTVCIITSPLIARVTTRSIINTDVINDFKYWFNKIYDVNNPYVTVIRYGLDNQEIALISNTYSDVLILSGTGYGYLKRILRRLYILNKILADIDDAYPTLNYGITNVQTDFRNIWEELLCVYCTFCEQLSYKSEEDQNTFVADYAFKLRLCTADSIRVTRLMNYIEDDTDDIYPLSGSFYPSGFNRGY